MHLPYGDESYDVSMIYRGYLQLEWKQCLCNDKPKKVSYTSFRFFFFSVLPFLSIFFLWCFVPIQFARIVAQCVFLFLFLLVFKNASYSKALLKQVQSYIIFPVMLIFMYLYMICLNSNRDAGFLSWLCPFFIFIFIYISLHRSCVPCFYIQESMCSHRILCSVPGFLQIHNSVNMC